MGRAVVRGAGTHSLSAGAGAWPRVTTARAISERHLSYEALRSLRPAASCQGRSSSPGNCAHVSRWQRGPDVSGRSVGGCRSDRPEPQTAPSEALPQATMPKPQSTESTDAARASCRGQHVSAGMMVAAWSSRATPPRPCRHPFTWDEVATKIDVTSFTVPDVFERHDACSDEPVPPRRFEVALARSAIRRSSSKRSARERARHPPPAAGSASTRERPSNPPYNASSLAAAISSAASNSEPTSPFASLRPRRAVGLSSYNGTRSVRRQRVTCAETASQPPSRRAQTSV